MAQDRRTVRRSARRELGWVLHIGYRKAVNSAHSGAMWNAIHVCPDSLYEHFIKHVNAFLPSDYSRSFGWEQLKGGCLQWAKLVFDPDDQLMELYRQDYTMRSHAHILRYLIETQPDSDWQSLAYWLGGRYR